MKQLAVIRNVCSTMLEHSPELIQLIFKEAILIPVLRFAKQFQRFPIDGWCSQPQRHAIVDCPNSSCKLCFPNIIIVWHPETRTARKHCLEELTWLNTSPTSNWRLSS